MTEIEIIGLKRLPRARGDRPKMATWILAAAAAAPRTRGSTVWC